MRTRTLAGICLTLIAFTDLHAGFTYTATTKGSGPGADMQSNTIQASIEGSQARMEFVRSGNPMMGSGTYMVTQDAGQTMYLVKPAEKTYTKWDVQEMMSMANNAMQMAKGMVSIQIADQKVEKLLEEKGPAMFGHPTTHTHFRTSYRMDTTVFGMKQSNTTVRDEEIWSTTDLNVDGLKAWRKQMAAGTGNPELDKLVNAQRDQVKGLPLKQVIKTTTTPANGQPQTSTMTMEVTDLKEATLPAAMFAVPSGYTLQAMTPPQMPPQTGGARPGMPQGANPFLRQRGGGQVPPHPAKP